MAAPPPKQAVPSPYIDSADDPPTGTEDGCPGVGDFALPTSAVPAALKWPYPLPFFARPPATGQYTELIGNLLSRRDLAPSQLVSQMKLRTLIEDATRIFSNEPNCSTLSVVDGNAVETPQPGPDAAKSESPMKWSKAGDASRDTSYPAPPDTAIDVAHDLVMVGDIHGQFEDLVQSVLVVQGRARQNDEGDRTFLFLGDYVDRGPQSVETLLLLLALKVEYPELIHMIRGNHEDAQTCKVYGFMAECRQKLQLSNWYQFTSLFSELPLAATVYTAHGRFFCCHGGLSPGLVVGVDDALNFTIRQSYGQGVGGSDDIVDGLLWSDPTGSTGFRPNGRGCGFLFGRDTTEHFCTTNKFEMIVRAHQMVQHGYLWDHDHRLLTVFSAPRYCAINDNLGAICIVHSNPRWLQLDQVQPLAMDQKTQMPLRISPLVAAVGARESAIEKLLEFVGFDSVMPDDVPPDQAASPPGTATTDQASMIPGIPPAAPAAAPPAATSSNLAPPAVEVQAATPDEALQSPCSTPPTKKATATTIVAPPPPNPDPLGDPTVDDYFGESLDGDFAPPPLDDI